jgi:hypothetical protein
VGLDADVNPGTFFGLTEFVGGWGVGVGVHVGRSIGA